MKTKIVLSLLCFFIPYSLFAADGRRYNNLGNPTEYVFSSPMPSVLSVLRRIHGPRSWGPLAGSYYEDKGVYGFGLFDFYTDRYWDGRRENKEEIDPPEAGRIGTIQNHFLAHLTQKGENQTLVSITVESFEQQIGRRYKIFPHFQKAPVFVDVASDTYYEYLFLLTLGEQLGEKGMPSIKGSP